MRRELVPLGSTIAALAVSPLASLGQAPLTSAPVDDVRYEVTFNAETAAFRTIHVAMTFRTASADPVLLSLPTWTPGSYSISNFARHVSSFRAASGDDPRKWDKIDFDTWRVSPSGAESITVSFDYRADTLDNGEAWSQPDFAFFNGTNIFLYPEGRDLDFASRMTIDTESDWLVATGMEVLGPKEYGAENFHDLVDMPVFIGRFDLDSAQVDGKWYRLASYPEGVFGEQPRAALWDQIQQMSPPMEAVFQETPWETYSTLLVFDPDFPGGSALEHQNSHVGIYANNFMGSPILGLITAHEIFHAWNVKRLRPADMVPYDYGGSQPTTLLWVSEGITDYYADLAMVRGQILPPIVFYRITSGKINSVNGAPPVALEDASLSTWISPTDGTGDVYYDKGSLAGFMIDILIRDATDNQASLDDVMRDLYRSTYLEGEGFTLEQWWDAVTRAADGRAFTEFHERFVDGRDPYPWDEVLPLAGMIVATDTIRLPLLGAFYLPDSAGIRVTALTAGGAAEAAGIEAGDYLLQVGDVLADGPQWSAVFRARYASADEGSPLAVRVRRGDREITFETKLRFSENVTITIGSDANATAKAARIRQGILGRRE